jgi:hypothetical protein
MRSDKIALLGGMLAVALAPGVDGAKLRDDAPDRPGGDSELDPGDKGSFVTPRLYRPLEPWFNQTWTPDDIEPI